MGKFQARPVEERLAYTVPEAAALLGVSPGTYYDAARRGEVPARKVGNRLLVPKVQLDRFLAEAGGPAPPARQAGPSLITSPRRRGRAAS